jgi:hypothetical protein
MNLLLAFFVGVALAVGSIAATTDQILNAVYNGTNALKVVGPGGAGVISGSGTANTIPKFTAAGVIANSSLTESTTAMVSAKILVVPKALSAAESSIEPPDGTMGIAFRNSAQIIDVLFSDSARYVLTSNAFLMNAAVNVSGPASYAAGVNPAQSGAVRLAFNTAITMRNSGNSADAELVTMGLDGANFAAFGSGGIMTRIRSSLGAPASSSNGDWWVQCTGTTPAKTCTLLVRADGATRTVATSAPF